jgi:hypothetical protein
LRMADWTLVFFLEGLLRSHRFLVKSFRVSVFPEPASPLLMGKKELLRFVSFFWRDQKDLPKMSEMKV